MQAPIEGHDAHKPPGRHHEPGPRVVRLFGTVVSLLWVVAFWSWGIQARDLVGRHGLLPLAEFFAHTRGAGGPTPLTAPSIFWLVPDDWAIMLALVLGIVCATLATFGVVPKRALCACALLYISFMAPAAPFFPMLADRLLLEATFLLLLLPRDRPGAAMQWLARGLIFKLYCEMGLSQWLAPDNGWQQGIALRSFLQHTALPTPLGFWATYLPDAVLLLATRCVVFVELFMPWLVFGTRTMRLVAALSLTLLQIFIAGLCNYGLFCWLAVALHLFLLSDADVARVQADISRMSPTLAGFFGQLTERMRAYRPWGAWAPQVLRLKQRLPVAVPALHRGARGTAAWLLGMVYLLGSLLALMPQVQQWRPPGPTPKVLRALGTALAPWHVVNSYAGLTASTGVRTEPLVQVMVNNTWQPVYLWHQPGDPHAGPKFVAPHQPRLDVQMSAYGRRGELLPLPRFVGRLLETLCDEPKVVARLFASPLPEHPQAVRVTLWGVHSAPWLLVRNDGIYWQTQKLSEGPTLVCAPKS